MGRDEANSARLHQAREALACELDATGDLIGYDRRRDALKAWSIPIDEWRGLTVIDALMRMGLVVGILGLGIVALRIVTERRHMIGILRAIGYKRRSVILALLTESAVTATIGTAVGIVAGVTMGYLFYRQSDSQPGFGIDLASIGSVLGLIYLAVLLVTLGPAWRASRPPPADAVRHTE